MTAVYLINRLPSKSLGKKSPYELLFKSAPSYNHLKCFGCLCFISTLPHNRDKFAPRVRKCVFLGYPQGIKGYKVLDLNSNSVHISRNIIFYEHIFPYAISSHPFTSYLDDFIFSHCTSDHSQSVGINDSLSSTSILSCTMLIAPFAASPGAVPSTAPGAAHDAAPPASPNAASTAAHGAGHTAIPSAAPNTTPSAAPSATPNSADSAHVVPLFSSIPSLLPTDIPPPFSSPSNHTLRRSTRPHKPPPYLSQYACKFVSTKPQSGLPYDVSVYLDYSHLGPRFKSFVMAVNFTPLGPASFHQAVQYPEWRAAMDKEIEALEVTNTWGLVPLPPGKSPIGCKWVYRVKHLPDGSIERYKAWLVAKGFTHKFGLDYSKTFSPVAKSISVRIVLTLAAVKWWFLHQMDVHNAFLHGDLNEDVYMCLPPGFHSKGANVVCKLNKSLYDLKQALRKWFDKFSKTILQMGFAQSKFDYSLFTHLKGFFYSAFGVC